MKYLVKINVNDLIVKVQLLRDKICMSLEMKSQTNACLLSVNMRSCNGGNVCCDFLPGLTVQRILFG